MAATAKAMEETITRVMDRTLNESVKKASRPVWRFDAIDATLSP
jgi:hypothetical protein